MKLPEPLFVIINPIVRFLLQSPIHALFTKNLMLITFTGRKSQKRFTTPVRYVRDDQIVRCFTSSENQWWRNLRGGGDVTLRIEGEERPYHATPIENNPELTKEWLTRYLAMFPQDAAYHDIRLEKDKSLMEEDLEQASRNAVVVEAKPLS